jgi:hypothetical protein
MEQGLACDFEDPGSTPCPAPAELVTVVDGAGEPVAVALCDIHHAYVADTRHVHHWYLNRDPAGPRTYIRMVREHG